MKFITLISMMFVLMAGPFSAQAKKPHPFMESDYEALYGSVTCTCDWTVSPGTCTVSWPDVAAPSYGVDVEFEAEWMEGDVKMKAIAGLDLDDNWMCDVLGNCSAGGEMSLPFFPPEADVKFVGKVKGFETGPDGSTSRDFIKATADCNLPADG